MTTSRNYSVLWRIALTVAIGLPACLLLSWYMLQLENRRQAAEYQQNSSRVLSAIEQGLQNDNDLLLSMRFYFDTVDEPSLEGFNKFATPAFLVRPELESVIYAPQIKRADADAFVTKAKTLFPDFKFSTAPHAGTAADHLYPIYFQQPDNNALLGMDLGSEPSVLKVLNQACQNNSITLLDKPLANMFLATAAASSTVELLYPLDHRGASFDSQDARCGNLLGMAIAQINLDTLISTVTNGDLAAGEKIYFNTGNQAAEANAGTGIDALLNLNLGSEYKINLPLKIAKSEKLLTFVYHSPINWVIRHKAVIFVFLASLSVLLLMILNWLNVVKARKAQEIAEIASEAKTNFLANMSHEIRTPMNAIGGMIAEVLESPITLQQREFLVIAQKSSKHLEEVVDNILSAIKLEGTKTGIKIVPYDFQALTEFITGLFDPNATGKGLQFFADIDPKIPRFLLGDEQNLRQVIMNLLNNSIKFTKEGHIIFRVKHELFEGAESLYFEIEDTGIGIAADKISSIFEKFAQEDNSTTREYGGTGLGLSISKEIVELMNGSIGVRSKKGQGSTFWFRIPFIMDNGQTDQEILPLDKVSSMRGLIIGMPLPMQQILSGYFLSWGIRHDSIAAIDPTISNAVEFYGQYSFILTDAEHDGWQKILNVKAGLKEDEHFPAILVCARMINGASKLVTTQKGVTKVVNKPILPVPLLYILSRLKKKSSDPNGAMGYVDEDGLTRAAPKAPLPHFGGLRVLLVEDNPENQLVTKIQLDGVGCMLEFAGNGIEAIAKTKSMPYDIIFMDCQMPKMDGYQATREIQQDTTNPNRYTPIVAITAKVLPGDETKCLKAGMVGFIKKPTRKEILYEAIKKYTATPNRGVGQS